MRDSHYWTAFALNLIIWLTSHAIFYIGINTYLRNNDETAFVTIGYPFILGLSFGVYLTFLNIILTNFAYDTLGIPFSQNFNQTVKIFFIVLMEVFLFLSNAVPNMGNEVFIIFLLMNTVLLLIQHYKIKKRAQSLTIRYIRTKKPFSLQSTLIILILIAILPLTFIDGSNVFIFFLIPIILGLLFQRLLKPLFAPVEFWGSVGNFLRIWAILQSGLTIAGILLFDFFQDSGIFFTQFGDFKLSLIVFTICNIVGGCFYIQFKQISYVIHLPKSKIPGDISTISDSSLKSLSSAWTCKHCQNTLDPSLFVDMATNIIIFCPYCGQKIYRDEHLPFSKEEILSEHRKVMAKLSTTESMTQKELEDY